MCTDAPNRRRVLSYLSALSLVTACAPKGASESKPPDDSSAGDDSATQSDDSGVADDSAVPDDSGGGDSGGGDSGVTFDPEVPSDKAGYCDQGAQTLPGRCSPQPVAGEGPFYRADMPIRQHLNPRGDAGPYVLLTGRILDAATCQPIANAEIAMWHANVDENYDVSEDFQCYGRTFTEPDGSFCFYGTRPVPYPDGMGTSYLPAHYHYKVFVNGQEVLTSQLYFEGDPYLVGFEPQEARLALAEVSTGVFQARIDIPVIVPA